MATYQYTKQQLIDYAERNYYANGKSYSEKAKDILGQYIIEELNENETYNMHYFNNKNADAIVEKMMKEYVDIDSNDRAYQFLRYDYSQTLGTDFDINDAKGDELSYALTLIKEELEGVVWSLRNAMWSVDLGLFEPFDFGIYIKQKYVNEKEKK